MLKHRKRMWVALLLLLMMAGSAMCEIVELTQECSYNYRNYTVTGTVGTEIGVKVEPDRGEAKPETQRITGTGTYGTATFRWGTSTAHGSLDEYIITVYNTSDPSDSKSITTRLYGGPDGFYIKRFVIYNPKVYDNGKIRAGDKVTLWVILMHPCGCSGSKSVTADLTDFGMGSKVDITASGCEYEDFSRSFMMHDLIVPDVPSLNVSIIATDKDGVTICEELMKIVYPPLTPTPTPTPTLMPTPISTPRQTITPTPSPTPILTTTPTLTVTQVPTPTPNVSDKSEEIAMEFEEVEDTVDEPATDETPPVQVELESEEVSIPGFTASFAIHGLLMIAALLRHRRN
ncbi:MAG TPA: hypothetical protein G4N95_08055 [Anaerolineae bacterium]|nr:hypothetical protein [Anaerolineae bacterium]